jgi:hypothetical protein
LAVRKINCKFEEIERKMFQKTATDKQLNLFSNVSDMLNGKARKQFDDSNAWHNQFRKDVYCRIDESIFSVLYDKKMGAPNSSIRTLISMMILKEGYGWSDGQLFEQCHFNLLTRSALGLFNVDDTVPVESTYYLLRKKIHEYCRINGVNLIDKTFQTITSGQAIEYLVNGKSIRMDSKLISSNIAWCTRYELIHQVLVCFCKKADKTILGYLSKKDREKINIFCTEDQEKVVYRSTREEIQKRLRELGILMYKLIKLFNKKDAGEHYQVLSRVFEQQYRVDSNYVTLRPKESLRAGNVQSPYDPDSTYRKKNDQEVKGYSVNITETCDKDALNLITDTQVGNAGTADNDFVIPSVEGTAETLNRAPENLHSDGAYNDPLNAAFCETAEINFYTTGIQGSPGRFDLEMTDAGLIVTDTKTGEKFQGKKGKHGNWRITTPEGYRYFTPEQIASCERRRAVEELPQEIKNIRNNVEAGIFQLSFYTRNNKTRYRGLIKHKLWATMRCLWINFRRIVKWMEKVCPNARKSMSFWIFWLFSPVFCALISIDFRVLIQNQSRAKKIWSYRESFSF